MPGLGDNVERWLIHENFEFKTVKSDDSTFKIIIKNGDGLGNNIEVLELNENEQEAIKKKIADFCYSIKAIHKFLDENGKKMVGVYIVLDKQEQLNQPYFLNALGEITEMSEKTNRFLIKAF